mmetsp:Transcript_14671/g.32200  ORF Transcript_14671/g.32200 Transcript_14671/m.32200 type:complete len:216 (+) Transcript_14671:50-697(+)
MPQRPRRQELRPPSEQCVPLLLLLVHHLKVLIDDGDGQENSGPASDGTQEISNNGQRANARTTEGRRRGDVAVQHPWQIGVTETRHHHLLVLELLGHIASRCSRDVDPCLGEERAGDEHESHIEDGVDRILPEIHEGVRGRDVVNNAAHWNGLACVVHLLPLAQKVDEHVGLEALVEELREEVEVGDERGLQDDGDVGGVEQLDGIRAHLPSDLL